MTRHRSPGNPSPRRRRIRFADRLLAEAVRGLERDGATPLDEPAAEREAREGGGDLETRIVHRAGALTAAPSLRAALDVMRQATTWIVVVLVVFAILVGAGAAERTLGAPQDGPVNFFLALLALLGFQTIWLLLWVLLMLQPRAVNVSLLGTFVLPLGRRLAGRVRHSSGSSHAAAAQATAGTIARGSLGRWTFSSISHAFWSAANVACAALLVILLVARNHTFHWESTIFSDRAYTHITQLVASAPSAAGFTTPSPEQVAATQRGGTPADLQEAREEWAGLLVGSIICYGLAPRLLLLVISLLARARARSRLRLDTSAPGYLRLRARLMPSAERRGIVDATDGGAAPHGHAEAGDDESAVAGSGPPVIVGIEIEPPDAPWPPPLHGVRFVDLGFVDGREDRHRVLDALSSRTERPRATVLVCALTMTPDRGLRASIEEIVRRAHGPAALLLTAGQRFRERVDHAHVSARVEDWRRLGDDAGIAQERILEIDLDHLTSTSAERLRTLLGVEPGDEAPGRRIESAFALVRDAAESWPEAPDAPAQATLHQRIAALYGNEAGTWRDLFRLPETMKGDHLEQLRAGADRVVSLLPDRLRRSPRWLAAGALSGALGCIAVGTLLAPAAIASLPLWAYGGAGLAAILQMVRGSGETDDREATGEPDLADAVRAAALFALLLELQGRDEAAISRILDGVLPDESSDDAITAATCGAWLDELRHRLDLHLAREPSP